MAHHNSWAPDPTYRISPVGSEETVKWQTTSYTAMVEISPNRVLLIYDRDPVVRPPERAPAEFRGCIAGFRSAALKSVGN